MKTSEFKKWLAAQGVKFKEGSKHTRLYYGKKRSTLSRNKEIPNLHAENIKKQLGLK